MRIVKYENQNEGVSMKSADRRKLESIADDLLVSFPIFIRRVSREEAHLAAKKHYPSRFVLGAILKYGPVPMSEVGAHMGISKPYMTALVDRLIDEGFVERVPDADDRRVTNVTITKAGREAFEEFMRSARDTVIKNLSTLTPEDISSLQVSMKTIRDIASRLDQNESKKCR